jgi:hypothetical protein
MALKSVGSILHQMAEFQLPDRELLTTLCQEGSLQRSNINSKDHKGRTPLLAALEVQNFTFLDIVLKENSDILMLDETFSS